MTDPYRYFRIEARELLTQLGASVIELEKRPAAEIVTRMLRIAHTLKGAARVVKQREIADAAHSLEEILTPHRESAAAVSRPVIDALLALVDVMGGRVAALTPPADPAAVATPERPRVVEAFQTLRADVAEMDGLLEGIAEVQTQLAPLRRTAALLQGAKHLLTRLALPEQGGRERDSTSTSPASAAAPPVTDERSATIEELTRLADVIGTEWAAGIDQVERELQQVRDAAERLRLIPAESLFPVLQRTARDAAAAQGKRVAFQTQGGDIRLDAHVLEVLQGALVQLVRNAVAHGIETEAGRVAAGKGPEGVITFTVARRGRSVAFVCGDDGRGIDVDAVRAAARRGGRTLAEVADGDIDHLLRLLLKGGISTSDTVTEVAGRGIGLDVVRESVDGLGGDIAVRTTRGRGTTVELLVPLSLASLPGLLVEAAGTTATIPLDAVREAVRVAPQDITRTAQGESIVHRGKVIPFVTLARALSAEARADRKGVVARSAVIVEGPGGARAAFAVDRLLGTATVVIRPLPLLAPAADVVAGVALDAEGNPRLVLEPSALVAAAAADDTAGHATAAAEAHPAPILVIDDSLTTRMLEQSILESAGFEVEVASSAEEGLEKAARKTYALFLVDVEMPGIDGFTFIERTRADATLRTIPAILVSSRNAPEDRQRGRDVGASGYVVKSEFDQGALLERIRKLVA